MSLLDDLTNLVTFSAAMISHLIDESTDRKLMVYYFDELSL